MNHQENTALIWDMDGILIDTEPTYLQIGTSLIREHGIDMSVKEFEKYVGLASKKLWGDIISTYSLNATPEQFIERSRAWMHSLLDEDPVFPPHVPGIVSLLDEFASLPMAVASSTSLPLIEKCLRKAGLRSRFDHLASGHEVQNGKPAPDVFLLAAERLGKTPEMCIVIEDSHNGVRAAKAAGMRCIGLQNPNSGNQDLSLADYITANHQETAQLLRKLVAER